MAQKARRVEKRGKRTCCSLRLCSKHTIPLVSYAKRLYAENEAFLLEEKIQPWGQMPLWLPEDPALAGFNAISITKALATGLTFRPLAETVHDTLAWDITRPADEERLAGLTASDEARLLSAWADRH